MSLHTVGYNHLCAAYLHSSHFLLWKLFPVKCLFKWQSFLFQCRTPLYNTFSHILYYSLLCRVKTAFIQCCAVHVLVLLRGLETVSVVTLLLIEQLTTITIKKTLTKKTCFPHSSWKVSTFNTPGCQLSYLFHKVNFLNFRICTSNFALVDTGFVSFTLCTKE